VNIPGLESDVLSPESKVQSRDWLIRILKKGKLFPPERVFCRPAVPTELKILGNSGLDVFSSRPTRVPASQGKQSKVHSPQSKVGMWSIRKNISPGVFFWGVPVVPSYRQRLKEFCTNGL
jgi:hypothetical protein